MRLTDPNEQSPAMAAQGGIMALDQLARTGDKKAMEELWRVAMLAADSIHRLTMAESTGPALRQLARRKTSWPFKLAAVPEMRTENGTASNPNTFAEWIGLGMDTGIDVAKRERGKTREFQPGTAAALAFRARVMIQEDLKRYATTPDDEILNGSYWSWTYGKGAITGKALIANQKTFLRYVQAIRAITDLSDRKQWETAAELWVDVVTEGKPEADGLWSRDVYQRAFKEERSVREVVVRRLKRGLETLLAAPSRKSPLP